MLRLRANLNLRLSYQIELVQQSEAYEVPPWAGNDLRAETRRCGKSMDEVPRRARREMRTDDSD